MILALAACLAAATILESVYDTPTAQYWVYRSFGFHLLLFTLGVNILCVAISRYPWKKKHIPFLLAHFGILILLWGSWMTDRSGVDGSLRISEGETASVVELDQAYLVISDQQKVHSILIPWIPPMVAFQPILLKDFGIPIDLKIDRFLSHGESEVSFVSQGIPQGTSPTSHAQTLVPKVPAIRFKVVGGPMAISQEFWLWDGSPEWRSIQAGPAHFSLSGSDSPIQKSKSASPSLVFRAQKDGSLAFVAQSSDGKQVKGGFKTGQIQNQLIHPLIHPGWKGNITITVLEWITDAIPRSSYQSSRVQYGTQAPPSAIHVMPAGSEGVWLGLGDRAVLNLGSQEVEVGYFPKRIVLPFSLRLERFTVEHDPGTLSPASYASEVTVLGNAPLGAQIGTQKISMNEPLAVGGFTVYQASYEDADPRPVTSIFSVNRDPGRIWKYLGSLLIVLGSIFLFIAKARKKL